MTWSGGAGLGRMSARLVGGPRGVAGVAGMSVTKGRPDQSLVSIGAQLVRPSITQS